MQTGSVGASISVLDYMITVNQYIIDEERYQRLPSFMNAKGIGHFASVKEQDVVEDKLEVGIGGLMIVYQVSARSL